MNSDFDTLSQAMDALRQEGYVEDLSLSPNCIECQKGAIKIFHDEFEIDAYFRFEGMGDPGDSSILYAISSDRYGIKGQLVNGYGIYSEEITDEMLKKLKA